MFGTAVTPAGPHAVPEEWMCVMPAMPLPGQPKTGARQADITAERAPR